MLTTNQYLISGQFEFSGEPLMIKINPFLCIECLCIIRISQTARIEPGTAIQRLQLQGGAYRL
eukprot:COSAG06_NODE_5871_length_3234_cov_1.776467_5_plen_63_part_00